MALLFMDGFDHYATADIGKKWPVYDGSGIIFAIAGASGRRGGGAFHTRSSSGGGSNSLLFKTLSNETTITIGMAINIDVLPLVSGTPLIKVVLGSLSVAHCGVAFTGFGVPYIFGAAGTALPGGTATLPLGLGVWNYIEATFTISNAVSSGGCKLRINGAEVASVTSGDTLNGATGYADAIAFGSYAGYYNSTLLIDDVYITNDNTFLGDCRIDTLYPTSDGTYSQFTPSTGAVHYSLVDEATPNTTDYNDGSTIGDRDSYGLGNLPALTSQTVYGVQVNAAMHKDDAGAKSASTFVRSSATNGDGASAVLGTSQTYTSQMYLTNPNGSIAWTETTVNAMEAGVRVVA